MKRYCRQQSSYSPLIALPFMAFLEATASRAAEPGSGRIPSILDLTSSYDHQGSIAECSRALSKAFQTIKSSPLRSIRNASQWIEYKANEDDRILQAMLSQIYWSSKASGLGATQGGIFPTFFPGLEHLFPIPTQDKEIKRTILLTLVDVLQNAIQTQKDQTIGWWKKKESPDAEHPASKGMILILFPEDAQINQRLSNSLTDLRGENEDAALVDLPRTLLFSPVRPLCELEGFSCGPRSILGKAHQFLFFGIVDPRGRLESDFGATAMNTLPESQMPRWVNNIVTGAKFSVKHQRRLADRVDLPLGQPEVFELHLSGAFSADMLSPFFLRLFERLHEKHDEVRIHLNESLVRELDLADENMGTFAFQMRNGEAPDDILSRFGKQLLEDRTDSFELQSDPSVISSLPRELARRTYRSRQNDLKSITLFLQAENPAAK